MALNFLGGGVEQGPSDAWRRHIQRRSLVLLMIMLMSLHECPGLEDGSRHAIIQRWRLELSSMPMWLSRPCWRREAKVTHVQ
jgi:hypothetical protein